MVKLLNDHRAELLKELDRATAKLIRAKQARRPRTPKKKNSEGRNRLAYYLRSVRAEFWEAWNQLPENRPSEFWFGLGFKSWIAIKPSVVDSERIDRFFSFSEFENDTIKSNIAIPITHKEFAGNEPKINWHTES